MDLQIKNKLALVTASTAGIGYAIAEELAAEGARVIINGRTSERVRAAAEKLRRVHPQATLETFAGDLTQTQAREALFTEFPSVDILVNNLGVYESRPFSDVGEQDWGRLYDVNVVSGAVLSQFYLKTMLQRNAGRIVFIASESGVHVPPDMIHYAITKAAQMALARGIAETTKGTAVTVNSVVPGPTLSEGVEGFLKVALAGQTGTPEDLERRFIAQARPTSLLQRFATAQEVASLVAYLASPRASATNGAAVRVEGGILRGV